MGEMIETDTSTLRGLAEWILKQPVETQMLVLRVDHDDYPEGVDWHGVLYTDGDWVCLSSSMTKLQYESWRAKMAAREAAAAAERFQKQTADLTEEEKRFLP
jgi:hypothetical protein